MAHAVAYRVSSHRSSPFWVEPNPVAHRFNHAGAGPTQYWSFHPLTPWAEYLRGEDRRREEQVRQIRLRLWAMRIDLNEAFHLDFAAAPRLGLQPDDLVLDDHGACRNLADRLRHDADLPKALRVPSAALPGTDNLVILGPRARSPYDAEPIAWPDAPTSVAADRARPPHALVPLVRYVGQPHQGLAVWRRGENFLFQEPAMPLFELS